MTSRIEFDYDGLARPETITSWIDFTSGEEEAFQLKYKYEDKVNRRTQVEAAFVLMDGGTETDAMPDYRIDYDWDKLNRVDMISQSNLTYDALDRRTIRRELISDPNQTSFGPPLLGGGEQRFLYDSNVLNGGFDEVVLIIDEAARKFSTSGGTGGFGGGFGDGGGSGNSTPETGHDHVQHRFLNGADVDQVFADETTTDFLWYLTDHQNSVTDVVESESSGATNRNHIEYDSFGNIITVDDPSTATADDGDLPGEDDTYSPVRGYTGREPDALTGLIYYRARWYDPNTGTFVSEDPIGFAAGDTNLTKYVGNGTPNATDPSGLDYIGTDDEGWAVWYVHSGGWFSSPSAEYLLGPVENGYIDVRASLGGGKVSLSLLDRYVSAGLRHLSIISCFTSLSQIDRDRQTDQIRFWIGEAQHRDKNPVLIPGRITSASDPSRTVAQQASLAGPTIAALGIYVTKGLVAQYGAGPLAGGTLRVAARTKTGELVIRVGGKVVTYGKDKVDDLFNVIFKGIKKKKRPTLKQIAHELDGKRFDDLNAPRSTAATPMTGMGAFGRAVPKFKSNFHTKLSGRAPSKLLGRKVSKITALQRQYPNAGISNLSKANRAEMVQKIQELARQRVAQGGGRTAPFLKGQQKARFFDDGHVTWVFDLDGTFHSVRIN